MNVRCFFMINVIFIFFFIVCFYGCIYIIVLFVSEFDVLYFDILYKYKC